MINEPVLDEDQLYLIEQANAVRRADAFGRSAPLLRLFEFLVERTLQGQVPKEIEIAEAVFDKHKFDSVQDASVRVYVHRLRRKLDDHYASAGSATSRRLYVPNAEYRLAVDPVPAVNIVPDISIDEAPIAIEPMIVAPSLAKKWWIAIAFAAVAANIAALAFIYLSSTRDRLAPVRATPFWSAAMASPRPLLIVTGDFYIFGQSDDGMMIDRLVREFAVNSRENLDAMIMQRPELAGHYVDLNLHYLPTGSGRALRDIVPIVDGRTAGPHSVQVITMSELTPAALRDSDVIYVGYLSGLGMLRDAVFSGSRFRVGTSYDELIDRKTGRHFEADAVLAAGGQSPGLDFAYLATFSGPAGNRILVIAGTRDSALHQAAEIASSATAMNNLADRAGHGDDIEALYRVEGLGDQNFNGALEVAAQRGKTRFGAEEHDEDVFPDSVGHTTDRRH